MRQQAPGSEVKEEEKVPEDNVTLEGHYMSELNAITGKSESEWIERVSLYGSI
jgi:hypothetical protein